MCSEMAVLSLTLRTRWMSPGGAKPVTSPVRFGLLPTSIRAAPSSESVYRSSYSTPARMPNTHQVTWSWMRVSAPGCQAIATIENEPSGSTCRRWLRYVPRSPPSRSAGRRPGEGRCSRSASPTYDAVSRQPALRATAPRMAVRSSSSSAAGRTVRVFMVSSPVRGLQRRPDGEVRSSVLTAEHHGCCHGKGPRVAERISERETEVLAALGARLSNAQIANRLHISVRTVESHVSSLLRKYGVADRWALAELARSGE